MKSLVIAICLCVLAATPATAQTKPQIQPTRDFTGNYTIIVSTNAAQPRQMNMTLSVQAATQKKRVEMNNPGMPASYTLADPKNHQMLIVMKAQNIYMNMPQKSAQNIESTYTELQNDTQFTRVGAETVAGLPCTSWNAHNSHGDSLVCLTDDGVILQVKSTKIDMTATNIDYAPLPDATFTVPANYHKLEMPNIQGLSQGLMPMMK